MEFNISGAPVAWKRAGRRGRHYYDQQIEEKVEFLNAFKTARKGICLPSEPFKLQLGFNIPVPKYWSLKRKQMAFGKPHTKKPDLDNLIKFVLDCLTGDAWADDCLIVSIVAWKAWAPTGSTSIIFETPSCFINKPRE